MVFNYKLILVLSKLYFTNLFLGCLTDENKTTSSINQFITIFYYPMKKKLFSKPMRYRCFRYVLSYLGLLYFNVYFFINTILYFYINSYFSNLGYKCYV